jgi:phage regulator Rha-like protein
MKMKNIMQIEQTMSSREIAELTGKDHADVLKDIRRILEEAEIEDGKFSGIYLSRRKQICWRV